MNTYVIRFGITGTDHKHKTIIDARSEKEAEERLIRMAEAQDINIYLISTWCSSYMN